MTETCVYHSGKPITSCCRIHDEVLCIECLLQYHKGCIENDHIEEIRSNEDPEGALTGKLIQRYAHLSEGIELWMRQGNGTLRSLKETETRLVGGIKKIRLKLIEQINDLAKNALEVIGLIVKDQEDIVKKDIQGLQGLNDRMVKLHKVIRGLRDRKSSHGMVISSQDLCAADVELNKIEDLFRQNRLSNRNVRLMFYLSTELENARSSLTTFGELCVEDLNQPTKRASRPFSFSIGSIPSEAEFAEGHIDGIDTSVFALSCPERHTIDNLYCSIPHSCSIRPHPKPPPLPDDGGNLSPDSGINHIQPNISTSTGIRVVKRNVDSTNVQEKPRAQSRNVDSDNSSNISQENHSDWDLDRRKIHEKTSETESYPSSADSVLLRTKDMPEHRKADSGFVDNKNGDVKGKPTPMPRKRLRNRTKSALDLSCYGNNDTETSAKYLLQVPPSETNRCHSDSFSRSLTSEDKSKPCSDSSCELANDDKNNHQIARSNSDQRTHALTHGYHCSNSFSHTRDVADSASKMTFPQLSVFSLGENQSPEIDKVLDSSGKNTTPPQFTLDSDTTVQMPVMVSNEVRKERPKTYGQRISAPINQHILLGRSAVTRKKGVIPLITGLCVTHSGMIFLCDMHMDRVQLFDTNGHLTAEAHVIEPFGCRQLEEDMIAITSRNHKSIIFFDVGKDQFRQVHQTPVQSCEKNEIFGLAYSSGYLAVCCLNRILVLSRQKNLHVTVQPPAPGNKSNKKYFQEVMFAELLWSDRAFHVFASDSRRNVVSCTNVHTNSVTWSVDIKNPKELNVRENIVFVAAKQRISLLRTERGQVVMEIRAGVPEIPYAMMVKDDKIYLSQKANVVDKTRYIEVIPFIGFI